MFAQMIQLPKEEQALRKPAQTYKTLRKHAQTLRK
jgi:hypothetical protein